MNYWDLLPYDIKGKILFDNLWKEAKQNFYKKQKKEFNNLLINIYGKYTDRIFKYKKIFQQNNINTIYQLKNCTKKELMNFGIKLGPYVLLRNELLTKYNILIEQIY